MKYFAKTFAAVLLTALAASVGAEVPDGTLPVGKNGQLLNLDFEKGTLDDWTGRFNSSWKTAPQATKS